MIGIDDRDDDEVGANASHVVAATATTTNAEKSVIIITSNGTKEAAIVAEISYRAMVIVKNKCVVGGKL
jgi:PHD/YefM family antitoxin component YafN of YafNO toxin-antitoxin module